MNRTYMWTLNILILLVIAESKSKNIQSNVEYIPNWQKIDSSASLHKSVPSLLLELGKIKMDSDDSRDAFLPKNNEKREIRTMFDLIFNIFDSIRASTKPDRRTKKRELTEKSLIEIEYKLSEQLNS